MRMITVEKKGLREDFISWGVTASYALSFLSKCQEVGDQVGLSPLMFNDSVHLVNPHQWFAANAAFWCRVYREAESGKGQIEALASIRALYFLAGSLGQGNITVMIHKWWEHSHELHGLGAPNYSPVPKSATKHLH